MVRIGTIDQRFMSYNIEMVEVTGGRFWKPYDSASQPQSDLFEYRPPIDLANPKLRKLALALAPAYLRVSGTWANATYFADLDSTSRPPAGFDGVLNRQQWQGVVDFSKAVGAQIVTSFAVSPGTRDAAGIWSPDQARRLLTYTHAIGGRIAAAEFMNEPDVAANGRSAASADVASYARDFRAFVALLKESFPEILILAPGTAGEVASASELLASATGSVDAISYHNYGTLSERCSGRSSLAEALSEQHLAQTDRTLAFYRSLRDIFAPGKPIWLTETAEAACGGNRWDATFLDTFRYLDQLGRLAAAGVAVVMHNTLAASDYGLLDQRTLEPRPNFWGAVLWRQLMGDVVLDPGVPAATGLRVYAHCQRGAKGGVSLLLINIGQASHTLILAVTATRYVLQAAHLQDKRVLLNGVPLQIGLEGDLPQIAGMQTAAGALTIAPATITFLTVPEAANKACQ
jgi:Glycosyl hydrolase family 79, N-terminal domain